MSNLSDVVSIMASIAEALAVVLAVWTIIAGQRDAKASRDLELFLTLSESFRTRWENSWADILEDIGVTHETYGAGTLPDEYRKEVGYMLNWVDWLGTVMKTGILDNEQIIFASIGVTIKRIINAGRPIIEPQVGRYGLDYWGSLLLVARRVGVDWIDELESPPEQGPYG